MSQSSSQQLEVAADWDHSEAAWRATHSPVVVRKPATSELPTERLNVVDSSLDWQRAMPDSMAAPMLPRNLPFAEVVLSLLLPLVRAIFKCFESSNFRDHDLANVLIGETLWRTQSAMRSVPMEQAWHKNDERFAPEQHPLSPATRTKRQRPKSMVDANTASTGDDEDESGDDLLVNATPAASSTPQ